MTNTGSSSVSASHKNPNPACNLAPAICKGFLTETEFTFGEHEKQAENVCFKKLLSYIKTKTLQRHHKQIQFYISCKELVLYFSHVYKTQDWKVVQSPNSLTKEHKTQMQNGLWLDNEIDRKFKFHTSTACGTSISLLSQQVTAKLTAYWQYPQEGWRMSFWS